MSDRELPSPELLRQLLRYEANTGKLFWRERCPDMFKAERKPAAHSAAAWNAKFSNKEAFTHVMKNGYLQGAVFNRIFYAHRIIWAVQSGVWPKNQIDHINRDRSDNRWENLREATASENMKNIGSMSGSTSKYVGVSWSNCAKKWIAQASVGKSKYIGSFDCEIEAAKAYDAAVRKHYGAFANPNFPM